MGFLDGLARGIASIPHAIGGVVHAVTNPVQTAQNIVAPHPATAGNFAPSNPQIAAREASGYYGPTAPARSPQMSPLSIAIHSFFNNALTAPHASQNFTTALNKGAQTVGKALPDLSHVPVVGWANTNVVQPTIKGFDTTGQHVGTLAEGHNPYHGTAAQQIGQVGGDVLNVASALPIGRAAKAGEEVLKGAPLLKTLATSALKTAPYGAGYGVTGTLENNDTKPQDLIKNALVGAGTAAVAGAALPAAGAAARGVAKGAVRSAAASKALGEVGAVGKNVNQPGELSDAGKLADELVLQNGSTHAQLKRQINATINDHVQTELQQMTSEMKQGGIQPGGLTRNGAGEVVGRYGRTSTNPDWYRKLYQEAPSLGKTVSKGTIERAIAKADPKDPLYQRLQSIAHDRLSGNYTDSVQGKFPANSKYLGALKLRAGIDEAKAAALSKQPAPAAIPTVAPVEAAPAIAPAEVAPVAEAPAKGVRAGTARINKAMGSDLPPSEYTVRPQAELKANSEKAAAANLDAFTGKVQRALAQTPGRLTDQQLSDAYTAAEKHAELGNTDLSHELTAKTLVHDSRTAQALAARGMLSKATPAGMQKMVLAALDRGGVKLEGALKDKVNAALAEVRATATGTPERELASRKLADVTTQAIPRSTGQKAAEFWRAMLISGPQTAVKVAFSQPFSAIQAYLKQFPAAGLDATRAALTGGERTLAAAPFRGGKGLLQGLSDAKYKLQSNIDRPGSGGFTSSLENALKTGHHQTAVERKIFATHAAIQKPTYGFIRDNTLAQLGKAQAINRGLKGAERKAFIDDYVKNPPADAYEHALAEGERATNQQRTALGTAANKVQTLGAKPGSHGPGIILAPITRVPGAIGTNALYEYSGLKLAKTAIYDGLVKGGKTPDFARTLADDFGKAVVGAGGVSGLGAVLQATGNLTPAAAADSKQAALNKLQGKPNGAVRLPGTHFWISLNALGPVGIELSSGGGMASGLKDGGLAGAATEGLASGGQELAKQPYVQGITGFGNALQDPKRYAESFLANLAGSVIPAFSSQIATGTDTNQRQLNYNSLPDVLKSRIPGLRETIPAAPDLLGGKNDGLNPNGTVLGGVLGSLDALKVSSDKNQNDPVTQELQRLYTQLDSGSQPSVSLPNRSVSVNGQKVKLNDQQLADYIAGSGGLIKQGVANLIGSPAYQALPDDQKAKQVSDIISGAHAAMKVSQLGDNPKTLSGAAKTALVSPSDLGASIKVPGLNLNPKLPSEAGSLLTKYAAMSSDKRAQAFNQTPSAEYQYNLAKYQNDQLNGTLSQAQDIRTKQSLGKQAVGADYSKNVRDLYSLSKPELSSFLASDPNGKALADQLYAYDQALYTKGWISTPKFKNGFGVSTAKGRSTGRSTRSTKSSYKGLSLKDPYKIGSNKNVRALVAGKPIRVKSLSGGTFKARAPKPVKVKIATSVKRKA